MKSNLSDMFRSGVVWIMPLAMASIVATACSDDDSGFAGGSTEDTGIVANLDVAGVSQKGPFVEGSSVTVQGIDCKTFKFTDEVFEGKVKSDKGDFTVADVLLKSTCALFEVTGEYRSEITGKKSAGEITLHALTDLKDRKNVNINVLTELEYERLMYLVTEKGKKFAEAKEQAEKEVLAAFDIAGSFEEFENLNIFDAGDENAALLAVSVMMQAETDDAGLAKRVEKFADSFAESGEWKDSDTKKAISEWAVEATANGGLDSIRKNVEAWNDGDKVAAFEKFIEAFGDTTYNAEKNTLTDSRDGQTYRTVKIGNQVWMAENLNYKTESSFCYNDSTGYCEKYGRIYTWAAAINACPDGWHLPTIDEFETLFATVGGQSTAGTMLKSTSGWEKDGNGTDDFGFTALPAGIRYSAEYYNYEGHHANFWSSTKNGSDSVDYVNLFYGYDDAYVRTHDKNDGMSVRCLKGSVAAPESSSSVPEEHVDPSTVEKGTMTDDRDGKIYRTVKIGEQVWMAENLNFETDSSYCYNDSAEYCAKYGRLYRWTAAMDACPSGWHLPDLAEWKTLLAAVGGDSIAGTKLKSTSGWNSDGNGTDDFGFTVLPAGGWRSKDFVGEVAAFWTSSWYEEYGDYVNGVKLYTDNTIVRQTYRSMYYAYSVRCVKGSVAVPKSSSSSENVILSGDSHEGSSSSSVALATPCKTETEDNCEYGTLTDSRDGQTYKTVKIGNQVWMAENLNYAYTGIPYIVGELISDSTSWCYDNDPANCTKYGRLYTWAAAMDSVGTWTANGKGCGLGSTCSPTDPVRGVCPSGWHLPTSAEWNILFTEVGGDSVAAMVLKSASGWDDSGNGTDDFGFSALPAGYSNGGTYSHNGSRASFWSSSEYESYRSYYVYMEKDEANILNYYKDLGLSVRCVKD